MRRRKVALIWYQQKKGKNPENVADVIGTWPHVKKMVSRLYAVAATTAELTDAYLDTRVWSGQVSAAERWRREGRMDGYARGMRIPGPENQKAEQAWILYISVDCVNEMSFYNFEIKRMEIGAAMLMHIDGRTRYCRAWLRSWMINSNSS